MPREPLWMGVDLGTQSVRALVVDSHGRVAGAGSQELRSRRAEGRHEQDPEDWWRATAEACREALAGVDAGRVATVACDSTSGTIVLEADDGRALTPGVMYDDARAVEEAEEVNRRGESRWSSLGYRMSSSWGLPKLLWLLRHTDGLPRDARLAHQADVINRRLVGAPVATDSSHALKTGYDLIDGRWPHDVFEGLEVPAAMLPDVVAPGQPLGQVGAAAARATGLAPGTTVVAGMTDGCAAQIGAGALEPGSWNSVLGTTLVLKGVTRELVRDPDGVLYSHRSPDGDWLPGGASSVGAAVLAERFSDRDLSELDGRAQEHEPATIVAYPLVSRGERFPFHAPAAEGFELGRPHDEDDAYAALLQGVAFVERLCFDHIDRLGAEVREPLRLTGGAARSRYWCQLRADVLELSVVVPEQSEPALGMAILASARERRVADAAQEMVRLSACIRPRPDHVERLREPYLRLVDELERRTWLPDELAAHCRSRARR
ncbi:MAG: FGGY family carbohydrate kinase [Solirubrobacteraceae bacterium]